jgi:hypothetical protein
MARRIVAPGGVAEGAVKAAPGGGPPYGAFTIFQEQGAHRFFFHALILYYRRNTRQTRSQETTVNHRSLVRVLNRFSGDFYS